MGLNELNQATTTKKEDCGEVRKDGMGKAGRTLTCLG